MSSIRSERVGVIPLSQAEEDARIARLKRAIQREVGVRDLEERGFSKAEIEKARAMIGRRAK